MEAQELFKSLKKQVKGILSTKDYQTFCSILGNIKSAYQKEFLTTDSFEIAKKSVSKMQSCYSQLLKVVSQKELLKLRKFISSCQSEVNAFGRQSHQHHLNLLEETGANIDGIPSYMFSTSSEDFDDYCVARRMADFFHLSGF